MSQKPWIALALVLGIGTLATARTASAMDAEKIYVGGNVGFSLVNSDVKGFSLQDNDFAWKVLAGYDFSKNFGAQATYATLGHFTDSPASLELSGWTIEATGKYPLSTQFDAYAKVGGFFWNSTAAAAGVDAGASGTNITGGLGLRYNLDDKYGITGEWQRYASKQAVDFYSVGFQYRF